MSYGFSGIVFCLQKGFGGMRRFGSNEKSRTFALPFEKRRAESSSKDCRIGSIRSVSRKKSKIFPETLAGLKKMRTFAAPFEKRVLERGFGKFIEKTDYCTRSKYREKIQFIEKR